jgi:hypothetical protein
LPKWGNLSAPRLGIIRAAITALADARPAQISMMIRNPKTKDWATAVRMVAAV